MNAPMGSFEASLMSRAGPPLPDRVASAGQFYGVAVGEQVWAA